MQVKKERKEKKKERKRKEKKKEKSRWKRVRDSPAQQIASPVALFANPQLLHSLNKLLKMRILSGAVLPQNAAGPYDCKMPVFESYRTGTDGIFEEEA